MATEEQLKVTIRTAADTSGAQQVSQALGQTQRAASNLQQQLSAQQQFANTVLRQSMAQVPQQTQQAFEAQKRAVELQVGARPTLNAEDLGIGTEVTQSVEHHAEATKDLASATTTATEAARAHSVAQEEVHSKVKVTGDEFVRFATAALGVGTGFSIASTAGNLLQNALTGIVQQAIATDQSVRDLTATFGAAAAQYQQFVSTAARAPGGFGANDIRSALEAVRPLAEQFNLTQNQMEGLVTSAQKLAAIHGIPLSDALNAMLPALQGNAAAAERLGLSMTDQQVSARAAGGAYRQTFDTLTDGQKVMLRYIELLSQIDKQQLNVANSGPSVTNRVNELQNAMKTLNDQIGAGPLAAILDALGKLSGGLQVSADNQRKPLDQSKQQVQDWSTYIDQVIKDTTGKIGAAGQVAPPRTFGPAPLTGAETTGPEVIQRAQQDLAQLQTAVGQLGSATNAQLGQLATREAEVMALNVENARHAMDAAGAVTNAIQVALARETDPAEQARLQARLDLINRIAAANESVLEAQRTQQQLQERGVELSAQQAAVQLQVLPIQQQMLQNERELQKVRLEAQAAALGPQQALEDLRIQEQRDQLILQNRNMTAADRTVARRDLRGLLRAQPGVELQALDAAAPLRQIDRARQQLDIQQGLQQVAIQNALAPTQLMIEQNQLLSQIAAAQTQQAQNAQQLQLTISLSTDGDTPQTVYSELIEANGQAQTPPVIQLSAVRRS